MIFEVCRTTTAWPFNELVKPCEEAFLYSFPATEKSLIFDENMHVITQEEPCLSKCWAIEINTLEELLEFKKKYGEEIILSNDGRYKLECIEIYDGWRE